MSDFIRNLIKWILVVILAVLVVFLIIKVANRGKQEVKGNSVTPIVDTVREDNSKEEEKSSSNSKSEVKSDENKVDQQAEGELIVPAEDTAADAGVTGIIGIIILGATSFYLLKSKKLEPVEE